MTIFPRSSATSRWPISGSTSIRSAGSISKSVVRSVVCGTECIGFSAEDAFGGLMKVLLMEYECSPYRGSEWAVGWGRLLQAARVAEKHIITSELNFMPLERRKT